MSSCLCKKLEGAVFPFQVKSLEDGVDNAVHRTKLNFEKGQSRKEPIEFMENRTDDNPRAHSERCRRRDRILHES